MRHHKPSATASLVLKALLFAANDPTHGELVSSDAVRWSRSIAVKVLRFPRLFMFAVQNKTFRWLIKKVEEAFNPGFILHVAARKAIIDILGRKAIESGVSQIIVIGAGYDTFGLRAATSYPHVFCFEIDHPATQEMKRTSIVGESPPNLFMIPADLSVRAISEVLASHAKFNPHLKTLIVVEGVLMYLPAQAVKNVFEELALLFQDGLTCIFTFMDRRADGDIQFKTAHPLVNWWLRRKHEQFLWGMERDGVAVYLGEIGFVETATYGKSDFIAALFQKSPQIPLAEGELVGITNK